MNIDLNQETIERMSNDKVLDVAQKLKLTKVIWKDNEYSVTLITDKDNLSRSWIFNLWKVGKNEIKYLIYKMADTTGDNIPSISPDDIINNVDIDFDKGEVCLWINIENGKPIKWTVHKLTHTAIFGITNSWKTVTLKWLLYQIAHYKHSEFIIIWKDDVISLGDSKKVRYVNSIKNVSWTEFITLINYIWLNVAYRAEILNKAKVAKYDEYQELIRNSEPWTYQELPHLFLIMDEFEQLRSSMGTIMWSVDNFDGQLKEMANYVRSYWVLFYFWSQNLLKNEIWIMRDYTTNNQLIWLSANVQPGTANTDLDNLKKNINWTHLFYSAKNDSFLRIPYENESVLDRKFIEVSEKNLLNGNDKRYKTAADLVNAFIDKIDSDIFNHNEKMFSFYWLESYYQKLKKHSEFIPFTIMLYILSMDYNAWVISGSTEIIKNITFKKPVDNSIFNTNKNFYNRKGNKLMDGIQQIYREWAQDSEKFFKDTHDLFSSYLKSILADTDLTNMFNIGDSTPLSENEENKITDDNKNVEKDSYNKNENINNEINKEQEKNNPVLNIGYHNIEKDPLEEDENVLLHIKYTGDIKPVSFNSMYYPDEWTGFKLSSEAKKYEWMIKEKILLKMRSNQKKQYVGKVILDIEFTLWISAKKDWELSKIGRNDLDNLLKATIDWIKWTIIKDDDQVYGIRTKINYVIKQNSFHKHNVVKIVAKKLNNETYNDYYHRFVKEKAITPLMRINLDVDSPVKIPSLNNMYVNLWKNTSLSSNTVKYKNFLKWKIKDIREANNISLCHDEVMLFLNFSIWNVEERDLDNMLKATIDTLSKTIIFDDAQVNEIICFKSKLKEDKLFNSKIAMKVFKKDISKDIEVDEDVDDFEITDEMFESDNQKEEKDIVKDTKQPENETLNNIPNILPQEEKELFKNDLNGDFWNQDDLNNNKIEDKVDTDDIDNDNDNDKIEIKNKENASSQDIEKKSNIENNSDNNINEKDIYDDFDIDNNSDDDYNDDDDLKDFINNDDDDNETIYDKMLKNNIDWDSEIPMLSIENIDAFLEDEKNKLKKDDNIF